MNRPNEITWQEINDPWNELGTAELDFEDYPQESADWWREQDQELERKELEALEIKAEMEELRHNGYWD